MSERGGGEGKREGREIVRERTVGREERKEGESVKGGREGVGEKGKEHDTMTVAIR